MISTVVFTLNEEINLPACLASLTSCDDLVVVDSGSSDRTIELARAAGARVYEHSFTGFGDQRQWALESLEFKHPWVLILDADERVTPALWSEMMTRAASCSESTAAFRLKRRFYWEGRWLRYANLYPSWVVRLVRRGRVRYRNRGHAETQEVSGGVEALEEDLLDENRKGLVAWRERQARYAEEEARYEAMEQGRSESFRDAGTTAEDDRERLKRFARTLPPVARGFAFFLYVYIWRLGVLDGWTGFRFCLEKACFQSRVAARSRALRRAKVCL